MVRKLVLLDSKNNIVNIEIWHDNMRPIRLRTIDQSGEKDVYWEDDPEKFKSIVKKLEGYFSRERRWIKYFQGAIKDEEENPSPKASTEIPTDTSKQPVQPDEDSKTAEGKPAEGLAATVQILKKWKKEGGWRPFSR